MKIGFKVRIYPNKEQEEKLFYYCKASHEMWNCVVAKFKDEKVICQSHSIKGFSAKELINEYKKENIHNRIAVVVNSFPSLRIFFCNIIIYSFWNIFSNEFLH